MKIQSIASLVIFLSAGFSAVSTIGQEPSDKSDAIPTSAEARTDSWEHHRELQRNSPYKDLQWRAIGPRRQGGRIESIAAPPGNTSTMYVGAGSGNLWKTVNNGITWAPIFEHESTGAIGDVAVSRSNPDVVWVGTGEVLMARSALAGMGVFKSTDAGATWQHMGLSDTHHIARVLIDPEDENIVYVVAIGHRSSANEQRGIFKTSDGGDHWERVLYFNDHTSAIDMVIDPSNPDVLYATTWERSVDGQNHYGRRSGVHKSTDAGETWKKLGDGLPKGRRVGRIAIDVAASNPNVIYALADEGEADNLYRSNNAGDTWSVVNEGFLKARWDWCEIRVSSDNEDELYSIGQISFVSRDGGKTFEEIGGTIARLLPHPARTLHLDTHAMWIDPLNTDRIVFGNDGGLFLSYDRGANWLHVNNLPIAEVYAVTYDMEEPYNVYIGTQDNAALFGPSTHEPEDGGPDEWEFVYVDQWGGGDSYFTYRDPSDWDTIYYEHQYGYMQRKSMASGKTETIMPEAPQNPGTLRFAWMAPFFPSTHQATTLYCGANRVFKSKNRGDDWTPISPDLTLGKNPPNIRYKAITALAESPLSPGLLYAGTDNGNLYVTRDDGKNWEAISTGLPRYEITRVTPSPHDAQKVFVTFTGIGSDDFASYVFRSNDQGKTWEAISNDLPLEPVHVIREDPHVPDMLYLGTIPGVYVSTDGGVRWHSLSNNLPTTAIYDLAIHPRENELIAGTHGRSVYVLDISTIQDR